MMYKGKRILILGMGLSGKAAASYLKKEGAELICVDKNAEKLKQDPLYSSYDFRNDSISLDFPLDLLIKSPGIHPQHPLLREAKEKKIAVSSEIELACRHLLHKKKKLFAITGSNGKTTTTLLTTHLLNRAGIKAVAVGNVGTPFLSEVDREAEIFVVELSSFQIEQLSVPVFDAGVILNITPNHLDRYDCFESYAEAKFALSHSLKPGASLYVNEALSQVFKRLIPKCSVCFPPLNHQDQLSQIAAHDLENLKAAVALVKSAGISEIEALKGWKTFNKPPHRIEWVGQWKGIDFVNDSKATSVDAVIKAVETIEKKGILLAGGVDKGGDFKEWIPLFKGKIRKIFAMGPSAKRIQEELQSHIEVEKVDNLKEAFRKAIAIAQQDETILLSPGCSSYDQFRDYQERGDAFKRLFSELIVNQEREEEPTLGRGEKR